MNDLNPYRLAQIGGALLGLLMVILLRVGTYSTTIFITWIILLVVSLVIFLGARKLDEAARDRQAERERKSRRAKQTDGE